MIDHSAITDPLPCDNTVSILAPSPPPPLAHPSCLVRNVQLSLNSDEKDAYNFYPFPHQQFADLNIFKLYLKFYIPLKQIIKLQAFNLHNC
jgi:hypothetical protein